MIRCEQFLAQVDAIQRNGRHLIVSDGEPGPPAANQEAVDARRMHQGYDSGIAHAADRVGVEARLIERKPQQVEALLLAVLQEADRRPAGRRER